MLRLLKSSVKAIPRYSNIMMGGKGCHYFSSFEKNNMDPEYMVEFDQHNVDVKTLQIPYLRDQTRIDMYKKHKSDPQLWNVQKLSQHYGTSIDRTNAVLYLMQKREQVQKDLGVLEINPQHQTLYEKHISDPTAFTPENLSVEFGINIEQVHQILKQLKIHHARLNTLKESETHMNSLMSAFEEDGIDTSFKEIPKTGRFSSRYHPRFFGDNEQEEHVKELKRLLQKDTKAIIEPAVDDYLKYAEKSQLIAPEMPNNAKVKTDTLSRWKFAFRDTSKLETQPTMIRSRNGGWRVANPYEESKRSWSPSPTYIDNEIHKHKFEQYLDFDKDEKAAGQLSRKKRNAVNERKKAKESATAGK